MKVPNYIWIKLCNCGPNASIRFSETKNVYVCKVCSNYPKHLVRECVGCGTIFIKNFRHPQHCGRAPLCWDCLHDPLCSDLLCTKHEHFTTYTYPPGINWHDFIEPPKFAQPVDRVWEPVFAAFTID